MTPDGRFVVHASDRGGTLNLWRLPLAGGAPERITSGPGQDLEPQLSADGRRIAFMTSPIAYRLLSVPLDGGEPVVRLALSGSEPWAPDLSPDGGLLAFALKVPGSPWRISLLPASGLMRSVLDSLRDVLWARFAPGGDELVFDAKQPGGGGRIGRVRLDGTRLAWLTPEGEDAGYPDLAGEGGRLAYVRTRGARAEVVVKDLARGNERVVAADATLPRFSPDGSRLALARSRAYAGGIGVVSLAGGEPRWLTTTGTWPVWMPDGRAVAYADVGTEGTQVARSVGLDGGAPRPLGRYRWRSTHFPFSLDRSGRTLVTTDDGDAKTTLWLAEY